MNQLAIDYPIDYKAHESWAKLLPVIRLAVDAVGLKTFCFYADSTPSHVCDAMAGRDRKRFGAEWLTVLLSLAPEAHKFAILAALASGTSFDVVIKKSPLTPAQELEALREHLRSEAPGVLKTFEKELAK